MDLLFEIYNTDFYELERDMRRLNEEMGAPDVNKMWAKRFTREQFDNYLAESARPNESRRLFVLGLVHNREDLQSQLSEHVANVFNYSASDQRKAVA